MPFHLNSGLPVDSSGWILCNISTCTTTQSILSALAKSSKGFNNVYIVAFNTGYAIAKSFSAELLDSLTQKYHLVSFLSFFLHPKSEFCHYKVVAPTTFGWWVYDDLMAFGDLSFQILRRIYTRKHYCKEFRHLL
ncbi:hypothetical protein Pelo_17830 [Pelomyxa schiedti]|nr:hypothetical protein Pelo_17830 [Pelomyxa schiedti]